MVNSDVSEFLKFGIDLRDKLNLGEIEFNEYNKQFSLNLDMSIANSGLERKEFQDAFLSELKKIEEKNKSIVRVVKKSPKKKLVMRNKVEEIVEILKLNGTLTENEINVKAFGYDRNNSGLSNKKYADMLRRGLDKGIIGRIDIPEDAVSRSKFLYYAVKENQKTSNWVYQYEPFSMFKLLQLLMKKILAVVLFASVVSCSVDVVKSPINKVNVLWENQSFHSDTLADSVAVMNPDKFVVNLEGPGSTPSKSTGPVYKDLVAFLQRMVDSGYSGEFVCKLETSKGDYEHDWNGKDGLPTIDTISSNSWEVYLTYFNRVQSKLPKHLKFSEVMIEPENNYFMEVDTAYIVFPKIKKFIQDTTVSLSATSDWTIGWKNWGVDYYYAQMYDICYGSYKALCGYNKYDSTRVAKLIEGLKQPMGTQKVMKGDKVYFIFTYSSLDTNKKGKIISHAPMFGEEKYCWTKKEFMEFNKMFKDSFPNQSNTGIWSVEDAFKNW